MLNPLGFGTRLLNLTFIQYRVKFLDKIRLHPSSGGPRPKSRLTVEGCDRWTAQNLSFLRFRNTSPNPVGFSFLSYLMKAILFFLLGFISFSVFAQDAEQGLLAFEKSIEQAVVATNVSFLKKAYASDFRFKHGTGNVDSKESWIKSVEKNKGNFLSRNIDSVEVEIHGDIGITNGTLTVTRPDRSYTLQYVRVYRKKAKQWELFMHRTVHEVHN